MSVNAFSVFVVPCIVLGDKGQGRILTTTKMAEKNLVLDRETRKQGTFLWTPNPLIRMPRRQLERRESKVNKMRIQQIKQNLDWLEIHAGFVRSCLHEWRTK